MSLPATVVWEVRTGGSDTNGGGFVRGGTGVDYSQQDAAQQSVDLVTNTAVVHTTTTQIQFATYTPSANDVDNVYNNTGGSSTAGQYRITAVDVGNKRWTLDRSIGTAAQTVVGAMGGALGSPGKASAVKAQGNDVFIKNGTYSVTSASTNIAAGCVSESTGGTGQTDFSKWIGYSSTRSWGNTDTKPLIQAASSISTFTLFTIATQLTQLYNLSFDCTSYTSSNGIKIGSANYISATRCKVANSTLIGIEVAGGIDANATWCEVSGHSGTAGFKQANAAGITFYGCEAHGGTIHGFVCGYQSYCIACLSYANSGASTDGFNCNSVGSTFIDCVSYANGRAGFDVQGSGGYTACYNCIAEGNTGQGYSTAGVCDGTILSYCAGYNNSSNYNSSNIANIIGFVVGSASFFNNPGSGDFGLNNTSGGGASARNAGWPGIFPAATTTGYADIGAARHPDAGVMQRAMMVASIGTY